MKHILLFGAVISAESAQAHTGHLAEVAGHGHWLGAAALGAAIAIGLWAGLKGREEAEADEAEPETEEPQEA